MKRLFTFTFCVFFLLIGVAPAQLLHRCLSRNGHCCCQPGPTGHSGGCCAAKRSSEGQGEVAGPADVAPAVEAALKPDTRCCLRSYHEPFAPAAASLNAQNDVRLKPSESSSPICISDPPSTRTNDFYVPWLDRGSGHVNRDTPLYLFSCSFRC